ncbi:hypothetical protein CHU95_14715 [Niveispirillum lacus]|uniref:Uncharacterized protein n=1 Tax=Niveispirillum lacus TaxID=1981099 RepID=A0A255YY60_9PROT|nr:hypothetical protein CHU95_14715 [Niveispirillum lacus]
MAERKHSQSGKAGGPQRATRDALLFSTRAPFLWRRPSPANDNPAPWGKRLRRAVNLALLVGIVGGLIFSAIYFR